MKFLKFWNFYFWKFERSFISKFWLRKFWRYMYKIRKFWSFQASYLWSFRIFEKLSFENLATTRRVRCAMVSWFSSWWASSGSVYVEDVSQRGNHDSRWVRRARWRYSTDWGYASGNWKAKWPRGMFHDLRVYYILFHCLYIVLKTTSLKTRKFLVAKNDLRKK